MNRRTTMCEGTPAEILKAAKARGFKFVFLHGKLWHMRPPEPDLGDILDELETLTAKQITDALMCDAGEL